MEIDKQQLCTAADTFLRSEINTTLLTPCDGRIAGGNMRALDVWLSVEKKSAESRGDAEHLDVLNVARERLKKLLDALEAVRKDEFVYTAEPAQVQALVRTLNRGSNDFQRVATAVRIGKQHSQLALEHFRDIIQDEEHPVGLRKKKAFERMQASFEAALSNYDSMDDALSKLREAYDRIIGPVVASERQR